MAPYLKWVEKFGSIYSPNFEIPSLGAYLRHSASSRNNSAFAPLSTPLQGHQYGKIDVLHMMDNPFILAFAIVLAICGAIIGWKVWYNEYTL